MSWFWNAFLATLGAVAALGVYGGLFFLLCVLKGYFEEQKPK